MFELPRGARMRSPDFAALRASRNCIRRRHFMLRYGAASSQVRLGMAVSRRVSRHAVERNRIKRQIRESFRHCRPTLPAVDVLVIAYRSAAQQPTVALQADLAAAWHELRRRMGAEAAAAPSPARR